MAIGQRRAFVATGTFLACSLLAGCTSFGGSDGEDITLRVGGPQANIIEAIRSSGIDEEFTQQTGATIEWIPGQAPDNLKKLLSARGKPPFDVVFMDNVEQERAIEAGALQRIDPKDLSSSAELPESGYPHPGYGPAWIVIRLGTCINTKAYQENNLQPPTSVDGWLDPKLSGRVSLPDPNNFYWPATMPAIAEHYGVPLDQPQQLVDRFKTTDIQEFVTSSSAAQASLQSGNVWLTTLTDGRCLGLKLADEPVDFLPLNLTIDGHTWPYVGLVDTWDIPTGSEQRELALEFIDLVLGSKGTLPLTEKFGYLPSRQDLLDQAKSTPELAPYVGDFSYDQLYFPDYRAFFPHLREWTDTWNQTFKR
ncbi:MAG: extracellular solute-binding protein [Actinophytocola sp.]|uniref:extracellular solute-binding protein n=1 Tax=Actinophytocola sp. TaxID=1872138 RepID=UPI00132C81B6|nr:extracellular solute-binding protein [Actinophytocola sp.]MPZ83543.1 extracellular solute-binding protein [Actinophytocola sp.]